MGTSFSLSVIGYFGETFPTWSQKVFLQIQSAENKVPDNQQKERQDDKEEEKQLALGFCPF